LEKENINNVICEINNKLNSSWIRGIYSLDEYSVILELYKKGIKTFLITSIKKNFPRFHLLLISKIPKELCTNSNFQQLLSRYIKGAKIKYIEINYPYILIQIKSENHYKLLIDYNKFNIILLDEKDKIISSINSKIDNEDNYPILNNKGLIPKSNNNEKCENFTFNKVFSDEFISKKSNENKEKIIKALKRELRKHQKLLDKLYNEKTDVNNKEYYKKLGELLKYNLNITAKGMKNIVIKDFDGKNISIPLNPKLSPIENMENYFKKYRKLLNKEEPLKNRIKEIEREINSLNNLVNKIENSNIIFFPKKLDEIITEVGLKENNHISLIYEALVEKKSYQKKQAYTNKIPFIRLYTSSGKLMLVGKNAIENDLLVKKFSRGNDLWFHSEKVEGSHVVLKYNKKDETFSEKDIEEASLIAGYYSKLRKYGEGNIVYTRCKYLNKPKKSKPGLVIYHNNKTIFIKIDETKVKKILDQSANYKKNHSEKLAI